MAEDNRSANNSQQDAENHLKDSSFERCPHDRENPYVIINRALTRQASLSFQGRGFLLYLLSHSGDWKINRSFIMSSQNITKHSLKIIIDELIHCGYIKMERYQAEKGYRRVRYLVSEFPKFKENIPQSEFPAEEFPPEEKQPTKDIAIEKKDEDIRKEAKASFCSEQSERISSKQKICDFHFDFEKGEYIGISEKDLSSWKVAYPSIDLGQEMAKSIQWLKSNPLKAKTKKKWRRFLTHWFSRQEDRISNKSAAFSSHSAPPPISNETTNLKFLEKCRLENPGVFDHIKIFGKMVTNQRTKADLFLGIASEEFEKAFIKLAGVRRRDG